jgi:hypothetical protein
MIPHGHLSLVDANRLYRAAAFRGPGWLGAVGTRIRVWATTSADYYAAAGRYEQLSRLCDVELARRGFSRTTLARDVVRACDRRAPS